MPNTSPYLIHKGTYAKLIKYVLPRVETFTLSNGWNDDKALAFTNAVEEVVNQNPILTSHLVWEKNAVYACPGTFTSNSSFVTVEEDLSVDVEAFGSHDARWRFINEQLTHKVGAARKTTAANDIKAKRPLFHAYLFKFANGHACYYISVSHALVDARTYYHIIEQISSFMNTGHIVSKINWGNLDLTTLETLPDHYNKRDIRRVGFLPLMIGFLRSGKRKHSHLWILDRDELSRLKKDQVQVDPEMNEFLSSHDIIMSTLCKLIRSSDEVMITMDHRERCPSFGAYDGGNCLKQWAIPCDVGCNPNAIRKAVNKGFHYGANEVSGKAILRGRVLYSTSWVTGYKSIEGINTICHSPSVHFVRDIPADTCILFPIDNASFGLLHNFRKVDHKALAKIDWIKEESCF
eukprot:scaffold8428_cov120-Skeletonema_dohrnii-CCMP3373.AAC.2